MSQQLSCTTHTWYSAFREPTDDFEWDRTACLHHLFSQQAKRTPDAVAVEFEGRVLTLGQLERQSNLLARHLHAEGLHVGRPNGIFMDSRTEYVVAYLASLKAGGAYMPLDVAYPPHLLESVVEDASPPTICTTPMWKGKLPQVEGSYSTFIMDPEGEWIAALEAKYGAVEDAGEPVLAADAPQPGPESLAYVVYSSGTTGKPKGICCPHRGAVFSYTWRHHFYPLIEGDRVAINVFFVWEVIRPLLRGYPAVIIPDSVIYDPKLLLPFLRDNRITRMLFTPSLFETCLNSIDAGDNDASDLASMRLVWLCGEVVSSILLARANLRLPNTQVANLYSVSECHDVAQCNLDSAAVMGQFCTTGPISTEVDAFILDPETLQPVAAGEIGLLFVAGVTVAIGYLNRPETTAQRFFEWTDPTVPDAAPVLLYNTGDRATLLPTNGHLQVLGRVDSMVKVRGYSIVLEAVEVALLEHESIRSCVVIAHGAEATDKRLVAYIVLNAKGNAATPLTVAALQLFLRTRLPHYAIPATYVVMDALPLSDTTGKCHRRKLPAWDQVDDDRLLPVGAAREERELTPVESRMVEIWAEVLDVRNIYVDDNFFALGGHSLSAARLVSRVGEEFGVNVAVSELFLDENATAAGLSERVMREKRGVSSSSPSAGASERRDSSEWTPVVGKSISLEEEAQLSELIVPSLSTNSTMSPRVLESAGDGTEEGGGRPVPKRVFLTGATGYVGAHILAELLTRYDDLVVWCLVRAKTVSLARARVVHVLGEYELWPKTDPHKSDLWSSRIKVMPGDLSQAHFGMDESLFYRLARKVDMVIHCGSQVNLVYPYHMLKAANVGGAHEALRMASMGGSFVYISTLGVFPANDTQSDELAQTGPVDALADGYCQSKMVAEALVEQANQRGIPTLTIRLGNMAAGSKLGVWNPNDFHFLFFGACKHLGSCPDMGPNWDIELTPVDVVAQAIVDSSMRMHTHDADAQPVKGTPAFSHPLHFVHPKRVPYDELCANMGFTKKLPWEEWKQAVMDAPELSSLQMLLHALPSAESIVRNVYTNQCAHTIRALDLEYPELDAQLCSVWSEGLDRLQDLAPSSSSSSGSTGRLAGRVAVVSGASSGIGAAIAERLAAEGARVALCARRKDRLEELVARINERHHDPLRAIAVKTDVTRRDQFKAAVQEAEVDLGRVDVLVNCAGVMPYTYMKNLHEDEWELMVDVNCKGVLNGIGAVLPNMLKRRRGHIINISSDAGRKVFAGLTVYSATKHFVEAVSRGLRQECAEAGVRVTTIQPGDVKTDLASITTDQEALKMGDYLKEPGVRVLSPEHIADACVFALTQPRHVAVNEILVEPTQFPI